MIPVLFIHAGNQEYLRTAIDQAKRYNERVALIGGASNSGFTEDHTLWAEMFRDDLAGIYRHMNFTTEQSIRRNIERWFALKRWMEANGEERAFYADSDLMLYCDVDNVIADYGLSIASLSICIKPWPACTSASGHCSYWSLEAIQDFCKFVRNMYTTNRGLMVLQYKWAAHLLMRKPGGVCDMTLLYVWSLGKDVINNAKAIREATFDENINVADNSVPDEYRMKDGIKEVKIMEDWPHGYNEHMEKWIAFNGLHFQGKAKRLMEEYKG